MMLGLVQMRIVMSDKDVNLHRAIRGVDDATDAGADVVVLPECCDLGWFSEAAPDEAESFDGVFVSSIAEVASAKGVYVALGFTERDCEEIFNSAMMLAPDGEVLLHHRKINLLDIEEGFYSRGTHLECTDTEFGRLALTVCADSWVSEPTKVLAMMGAEVVISPSAWACDRGSESANADCIRGRYIARTSESGLFLAGCDGVGDVTEGPWKGRVLHGNSLVCGPGGRVLAEGKKLAEDLLMVEVDPAEAGSAGRK